MSDQIDQPPAEDLIGTRTASARARDRVGDSLLPAGQRGPFRLRAPRPGPSARERHEGRVARGRERPLDPQAKRLAQADDLVGIHALLEGAAAFA
jgi:hypothetical protein